MKDCVKKNEKLNISELTLKQMPRWKWQFIGSVVSRKPKGSIPKHDIHQTKCGIKKSWLKLIIHDYTYANVFFTFRWLCRFLSETFIQWKRIKIAQFVILSTENELITKKMEIQDIFEFDDRKRYVNVIS